MTGMMSVLNELYIRFMVWLGAAPPPGYEYLIGSEAGPTEYTLQEGDNLFSVARKFGIHHELVAKANHIEDPTALRPGDKLIIPAADWNTTTGPLTPAAPLPPPEVFVSPAPPPLPEVIEQRTPTIPVEEMPEPLAEVEVTEAEVAEVEVAEPEVRPKPASPPQQPEWLLAMEPAGVETESGAEAFAAAEREAPAEEIEWLIATEPLGTTETQEVVEEITPPPAILDIEPAPVETQPKKGAQAFPVEPVAEAEPVTEPVAKMEPAVPVGEQEMVFRYEIQRGDTLNAIARRYGLTVKQLVEANNISDSSRIFPGQKLIIPGYMPTGPRPHLEPPPEPPPAPVAHKFFVHTVTGSDTLNTIAKRFGVTVRQLIEANRIEDPELIQVGQRLIIPGVVRPPELEPEPPPQPGPVLSLPVDPDFPPQGRLDAIRAFYVSYFAIGHAAARQRIFDLLDTTELNAVVIDAKGDFGWLSYPTQLPLAQEISAARPAAKDFEVVMAQLKERGVYTIARVVTFKDNPLAKSYPEFAVKVNGSTQLWQDREQSSWTDPFLKPVWDYNVQVAVEAAQMGFDEIQFDCVRFPTPSQAGAPQFSQEATRETRVAAIAGFLSLVRGQLKPFGVKVAAATFGYTCWRKDDTLIGQDIDRLGQYLDVLCPMLYPSTFGSGIPGYKFAIAHPYEVVYHSAQRAVERVAHLGCAVRPWIQDFPDYRFDKRVYGREEIQAQIKACFDAGAAGFMVWDPQVKYTHGAYAPVTGQP